MNVLYLGPKEFVTDVKENLPGYEVLHADDDPSIDKALPSTNIILDASLRFRFRAERMDQCRDLRLFVAASTGTDHIESDLLELRNIPLLTLLGQPEIKNVTAAAEMSWLLLMAAARQLRPAMESVLQCEWDRSKFPGLMLNGRSIGIIGLGRIGTWMSRYATTFGMAVHGYDPFVEVCPDEVLRHGSLEEMLPECDFVSIHVPLSAETKNLINRKHFDLMRNRVVVVNTSRGQVIDEDALFDNLMTGKIGAAALDVLSCEPEIVKSRLWRYAASHKNLIITPHIAGCSPDALRFVLKFCCRRIMEHGASS
jgi:D-3-phosphoglycerate dehydrogenase